MRILHPGPAAAETGSTFALYPIMSGSASCASENDAVVFTIHTYVVRDGTKAVGEGAKQERAQVRGLVDDHLPWMAWKRAGCLSAGIFAIWN